MKNNQDICYCGGLNEIIPFIRVYFMYQFYQW